MFLPICFFLVLTFKSWFGFSDFLLLQIRPLGFLPWNSLGTIFTSIPPRLFHILYQNWKLFPLSKLHEIEPLKSYMKTTTAGRVDQLWTKGECSIYPQPLLGKVKSAGQGCGLHASSEGSLEWQLKP